VPTPHCAICGRWNDPAGGQNAHSGGCPNTGKPYPSATRVPVEPHYHFEYRDWRCPDCGWTWDGIPSRKE